MNKVVRLGCAILSTAGLIGCSADSGQPQASSGDADGSLTFNLAASSNVHIDSIAYDLTTQAGANVVSGSIPVVNDKSQGVHLLGVQALAAGDYKLSLSATGKLPDNSTVPCTSSATAFHVTSGTDTFIGTIALNCTIATPVTSGAASADVSVNVNGSQSDFIEAFSYSPRSVDGVLVGSACTFPAIDLQISNLNSAISYSWKATPDGQFSLNATNTSGTYTCASSGDKTLTLTGTLNGQTATKSVTVTCNPCGTCGNGTIEAPEQCDNGAANSDTTPNACRTNCTQPKCGDNVVDTGEACDPPNGVTCDSTCHSL